MGDLSRLKGTQSNSLCSGFGTKKTSHAGFLILFSTGTYAGIGTKCVESENIVKSTYKKKLHSQICVTSFILVPKQLFLEDMYLSKLLSTLSYEILILKKDHS